MARERERRERNCLPQEMQLPVSLDSPDESMRRTIKTQIKKARGEESLLLENETDTWGVRPSNLRQQT